MSEFKFRRVCLRGLKSKLTREEWDEIEIALGAAAVPGVTGISIVRNEEGLLVAVATLSEESGKE